MPERGYRRHFVQRAVRHASVVFLPCHLASVGREILSADVVVLSDFGATQAREVGLGLVRASAVQAVCNRMVDPVHLVVSV